VHEPKDRVEDVAVVVVGARQGLPQHGHSVGHDLAQRPAVEERGAAAEV
jgi:hypothetical protein